jgi:hypothetical protein
MAGLGRDLTLLAALQLAMVEEILLPEAVEHCKSYGLWDPDDVDVTLKQLSVMGVMEMKPVLVARWSDGVFTTLKVSTHWPTMLHP